MKSIKKVAVNTSKRGLSILIDFAFYQTLKITHQMQKLKIAELVHENKR